MQELINKIKAEYAIEDVDFSDLDEEFMDYLPRYIQQKVDELKQLLDSLPEEDTMTARSMCHSILGTARSFGLLKLDREVGQVQQLVKSDFGKHMSQIKALADSSLAHLLDLKNQFREFDS